MLELVGEIIIHVCMSTDNTRQVMAAVTIIVDGTVCLSVLVFKGKPDGWIARLEFSMFPPTHHYYCQPIAWLDKAVMIVWVGELFMPYVEQSPGDIVPHFVYDSYQCHVMASVV